MKVLSPNIILKLEEKNEVEKIGLSNPQSDKDAEIHDCPIATVIDVHKDSVHIKPGQTVALRAYAYEKLKYNEEECVVCNEEDILVIL